MRRFECSSVLTAVSIAALTLMISMSATWPALAAVGHDAVLRNRLDDVRELLHRRQAHRHMLTGQIKLLSLDLDNVQLERNQALKALSGQEDKSRGFERELDRLMPRLLPRLNALNRLRREGARTIANLATAGRGAALKDETRTRFMATKTVSINQMRRASTSVRLLRRVPSDMVARHRDLDFQIPLLAAAVGRLQLKQDHLQRRRDAAVRDLADLNGTIERLATEEHRLARNMLARGLTATAGSNLGTNDIALADRRAVGKSDLGNADVRGAVELQSQSGPVARPWSDIDARANTASASLGQAGPALTADGKAATPVASWASRDLAIAEISRESRDRAVSVAALQLAPADSLSAGVGRGRVDGDLPLVPTSETIGYTLGDAIRRSDLPAIEIPARSRQRVAAPDDGRIVFAGDFRSYGLLLIIEHGSGYHTLLWGFSSLDIELGDPVLRGQILGSLGAGKSPKLHVELRRNGRPVSPEVWLAASNSGVKG